MSLHILEDQHFNLLLSNKGSKFLCTGIQGISLILFYTPDCEYCGEIKESFKALSQLIRGVKFGTCNLRQCPKTRQLSRESTTVLQYVPYVLCFVNGKPYAKYDGDRSIKGLKDFIQLVHTKVEQFKKSPQLQQDAGGVPEGGDELSKNTFVPQNRAKRCYLTMDEAYPQQGANPSQNRQKYGGYKTYEELYGKSLDGSGMNEERSGGR